MGSVRTTSPKSDRPKRVREVLGLHRQQVSHGLRNGAGRGRIDTLGELSKPEQLARTHLDRHPISMSWASDLIEWTNHT
jgi:hypothetical protein